MPALPSGLSFRPKGDGLVLTSFRRTPYVIRTLLLGGMTAGLALGLMPLFMVCMLAQLGFALSGRGRMGMTVRVGSDHIAGIRIADIVECEVLSLVDRGVYVRLSNGRRKRVFTGTKAHVEAIARLIRRAMAGEVVLPDALPAARLVGEYRGPTAPAVRGSAGRENHRIPAPPGGRRPTDS